jgi:hypothetical protein
MTLLLDTLHTYRGYHSDGGVCRIRIYEGTEASGGAPIVLATELPYNRNTSVTNMCEYLAAEVFLKHLAHRDDEAVPFLWIEHYTDGCSRPPGHAHHGVRDILAEHFDRAVFESMRPKRVFFGGVDRVKLGKPEWTYVGQEDFERLIGAPWTMELEADYPEPVRA